MQDMAAAVRAGFDFDGSLSYGAGDYTFDFVERVR